MAEHPGLFSSNKLDPTQFDMTVGAFLTGLGAEKYIEIFRKQNIGQCTLIELTDEDLTQLGVGDEDIRRSILQEVKNLPIYEDGDVEQNSSLGPLEIVHILEESSSHLYRIYLSMLANTITFKKMKIVPDSLLYKDKYASDIALCSISEINTILNSMEITLQKHFKEYEDNSQSLKKKKIVVCSIGTVAIAVLAVLLFRSIKHI